MLVDDLIRHNSLIRPRDEALVVGDLRLTYGELQERIGQVSAALRSAGIGRGERVAVLAKNTLEYLLLYFATASTGSILVPLNFWHRQAEHEYVIGHCEPSLLFVEDELRPTLGALPGRTRVLTMPVASHDRADWESFIAAGNEHSTGPSPEVEDCDPHMILYTSGTTGRPKGAILSHGRTVRDASRWRCLSAKPTDTFMDYFPSFHVGNWDHMKLYMLVGARVVLLREFDAEVVYDVIAEHRPTVILGVPTMFHSLLGHPRRADADPPASPRLLRRLRPERPDERSPTPSGHRRPRRNGSHLRPDRGRPVRRLLPARRPHPSLGVDRSGDRAWSGPCSTTTMGVPQGCRRDLLPGPAHERLLGNPETRGLPRRLDAHRRHGGGRRGRLPDDRRPQEGHDPQRRPERLLEGGRGPPPGATRRYTIAVVGLPDALYEESVCAVVVPNAGSKLRG